jgi:L-threonylcarbamoyladenylate synthase
MPAQLLSSSDRDLQKAADALRRGEVVGMPTETVYGLAAVAFDKVALATVFAVKERPTFDPLICHVAAPARGDWLVHLAAQGLVDAEALSIAAHARLELLANAFWPGPLTMVLPKQARVPDLATSGLPTVGVRCPRHRVAQELLKLVGAPLAAPSANRFGRISPTTAAHVMAELGDRIPYVIDGGTCDVGIESTVVLIEASGAVALLRPGGIEREAIEAILKTKLAQVTHGPSSTLLPSPGLLASHYAPRKPLRLLPKPLSQMSPVERAELTAQHPVGILLASGDPANVAAANAVILSLSWTGDRQEAAHNLFARLRALDDDPRVEALWAELCPDETGLGFAINDRLRKASHR